MIALIDENTRFTVETPMPCLMHQSRSFPASAEEYNEIALSSKSCVT